MCLRNEKFEFDSDELDLLELDREDANEPRSSQVDTYVFEGRVVVRGTAGMREGQIVLSADAGAQTCQRAQRFSTIPGIRLETEPTDDIDFDLNDNVRIGVPETKDS